MARGSTLAAGSHEYVRPSGSSARRRGQPADNCVSASSSSCPTCSSESSTPMIPYVGLECGCSWDQVDRKKDGGSES
jgi:hypothetical protein